MSIAGALNSCFSKDGVRGTRLESLEVLFKNSRLMLKLLN